MSDLEYEKNLQNELSGNNNEQGKCDIKGNNTIIGNTIKHSEERINKKALIDSMKQTKLIKLRQAEEAVKKYMIEKANEPMPYKENDELNKLAKRYFGDLEDELSSEGGIGNE